MLDKENVILSFNATSDILLHQPMGTIQVIIHLIPLHWISHCMEVEDGGLAALSYLITAPFGREELDELQNIINGSELASSWFLGWVFIFHFLPHFQIVFIILVVFIYLYFFVCKIY